jgi:hypothetical protein
MAFLICLIFLNIGTIPMIANNIFLRNQTSHEDNNKPECWTDEIRNNIIKKYTKKYGLRVCAISDEMPSGVIYSTGIGFTIDQPISKQKARQILVECVQEYIQAMNNKKEIRPYLKDFPVTAKNIEVNLFIHDTNGDILFYPNIGMASVFLGSIEYKTRDPKDKYTYKTVEEETFEEAVIKAKEELPKEDLL